jgi:hypothetical protein
MGIHREEALALSNPGALVRIGSLYSLVTVLVVDSLPDSGTLMTRDSIFCFGTLWTYDSLGNTDTLSLFLARSMILIRSRIVTRSPNVELS